MLEIAAVEAILDRGPRREKDVVLIRAQQVGALFAEHADHLEGHVLDADLFADRVAVAEKLAHERFADQAHLFAGEQLALVEDPPQLQLAPVAHLEEIRRAARHAGTPIAVAVDHLAPGIDDGGRGRRRKDIRGQSPRSLPASRYRSSCRTGPIRPWEYRA